MQQIFLAHTPQLCMSLLVLEDLRICVKTLNLHSEYVTTILYAEVFPLLMKNILISLRKAYILLNGENNKIQTGNCLLQIITRRDIA